MIAQPVLDVSRADVERVVRRDFPAERATEVLAVLDQYGAEPWHEERDRVHLAALKLAAGDVDRLRARIAGGRIDARDLIAAAEYPAAMRLWSHGAAVPDEEARPVIDADCRQYREWLAKG
jgi:hypothetical protein